MPEYRLSQEIVKRSTSNSWDKAKLEWELLDIYKSKEADACLCGHFPILEICVLTNKNTRNRVIVGNCCVNKFMGIDSDKLFKAIQRVQNKITNSLNPEVIQHALSKRWINQWEANFYIDIWRKKKLSESQQFKKIEINRKILPRIIKK